MSNFLTIRYHVLALSLITLLFVQCDGEKEGYKGERAAGATDSTGNAYPRDMVQEDTNLEPEDDMPMEVSQISSTIDKQKLLALLMRQKTDMRYRIEELEAAPGDASDNTVVQGDMDKLRLYVDKLDQEIVNVRKAQAGSMKEAAESALGAIKGAGALMQSTVIRVDRGF